MTTPFATTIAGDTATAPSSTTAGDDDASSKEDDCYYYMPADWSRHSACILLYPHNAATFCLKRALPQFHCVVETISRHEDVVLFCNNDDDLRQVQTLFQHNSGVTVYTCPSDDTWARDTAPTFVVLRKQQQLGHQQQQKQQLLGLDWDFNAYGGPTEGCYWPCHQDRQVAQRICHQLDIKSKKVPLILEGGSIHTDGQGTLLTTEECLLNPNRNPKLAKLEIERLLLQATGCTKLIWLPHGLAHDDDTNGHVDNWACFIGQPAGGHVVLAWTDDLEQDKENYQRCRQALQILEKETDAQGRSLTVHKLHLPRPMYYTQDDIEALQQQQAQQQTTPKDDNDNAAVITSLRHVGDRMAASYVNFYMANDAVLVPQFGDSDKDSKALQTLQALCPDRTVVGIPSREILVGGGNLHCITQQVPEC